MVEYRETKPEPKHKRVLAILAHYDDEALFCASTLQHLGFGGSRIMLAVVTGVYDTNPGKVTDQDSYIAEERRKAARLIAFGRNCVFLSAGTTAHYCFPNMHECDEATERYVQGVEAIRVQTNLLIEKTNPDLILTHSSVGEYGHVMHRAVHDAVLLSDGVQARAVTVWTFGRPDVAADVRFPALWTEKNIMLGHYKPWDPRENPNYAHWLRDVEEFNVVR